jgi:hypothetical protein
MMNSGDGIRDVPIAGPVRSKVQRLIDSSPFQPRLVFRLCLAPLVYSIPSAFIGVTLFKLSVIVSGKAKREKV